MGLFEDIRAFIDPMSATDGDVRVRDLVSTGQVTAHILSDAVRFLEDEPQGGGDDPEGGAWLLDQYGVPYWSPTGEQGTWCIEGDVPVFEAASGITTIESIEDEEQAEQDAAERAFLREFGMGTWLSSQPRRFSTTRVEWGA